MSSPAVSNGQRVPAWKRLGLKLKSGASADQPATHSSPTPGLNPPKTRESAAGLASAKRKPSSALADQTPSKKAKSVSFADQQADSYTATAVAATNGPSSTQKPNALEKPKQKQKQKVAKQPPGKSDGTQPGKQGAVNLEPALQYLRQWKSSKDTWKFNKNHQTRLLEQLFAAETTVPAVDINVLYEYIRGLKGGVRQRLRELANGIKAQDMEQGATGFSSSAKASSAAAQKQKEYEDVIATFLSQSRTPGKRRFEEVNYVLRTADMEMQRRVVKRMRAETVLDELSESNETDTTSSAATTTTTTGTEGPSSSGGEEGVRRLSLSDGSQQRVKRRRKTRTAVIEDDSSSSESSSDSESDSSSSSSSSDDSDSHDDNAMATAAAAGRAAGRGAKPLDTSSSSSSSSSSEDESDSDDASDSEEEEDDESDE